MRVIFEVASSAFLGVLVVRCEDVFFDLGGTRAPWFLRGGGLGEEG